MQGDGFHNAAALLGPLIDTGLRVLIYAGETDMSEFFPSSKYQRGAAGWLQPTTGLVDLLTLLSRQCDWMCRGCRKPPISIHCGIQQSPSHKLY